MLDNEPRDKKSTNRDSGTRIGEMEWTEEGLTELRAAMQEIKAGQMATGARNDCCQD